MFAQIAQTQRHTAACHRSSAALQESFARRTAEWTGEGTWPRFMAGVADVCGSDSAALILTDSGHNQLAVAVSDERSRAAEDLEYILGEGPSRDAASELHPVEATGQAIGTRWPAYGSALLSLGIVSVTAVPMRTRDSCIGALAAFNTRPALTSRACLADVAAALVRIVLLGPDADPGLYGGTDLRATVQQAAGMLSARIGCGAGDALALIKARAFTDNVSIETIAESILHRRAELDWGEAL